MVSKQTTQTLVTCHKQKSTWVYTQQSHGKVTYIGPVTYFSDRGPRSTRPHTLSYTDPCLQNMSSRLYSDHSQMHSQGRTCKVYILEYQKVLTIIIIINVVIIIIITVQCNKNNKPCVTCNPKFAIELDIFHMPITSLLVKYIIALFCIIC